MARDEVVLDGDISLEIPLDGDAQLDLQMDGSPGLMSLIDVGIAQIIFNDDYTVTFVMTDGRKFTTGSIRGATGVTGEKGDKGDKGDTGDIGPMGPQGIQGVKGDTGAQGPKGDKGDKGEQGIQGERGEQGEKGDTGPQGVKGNKGDTGPRGEKGDKGDTGEKGDKGDKGDAGDDYVLTQADKQEIARLVDVPVDDVQINGTSIVSDGVAEIPTAENNKNTPPGLVKVYWGGLTIDSNGFLKVSPASDGEIKKGSATYAIVAPQRQHNAVFYGLAKVAGHDEKDSTLPVGTYTEDAIIAIQKMLGVYQAPWELIEDFTLEEDGGFDKSAEPDGTPYNFRAAYVRITVPPNSTSIASGYGRWYFVDENNTTLTAESGRYTANTAQMCKTILIERNANMAMAKLNSYTSVGGRGMLGYKNITGISFNYGSIKRIYNNTADKEPAGARIEIYAQRAY